MSTSPPPKGYQHFSDSDPAPIREGPADPPKTTFGVKRQPQYYPSPQTFDYEQKYPPAPEWHDLNESSRLWNVYNDEAEIFNKELLELNGDSLDILLIFAALFSAVVTTFVVETSSALDTDNSQVAVNLLVELVALQRAGSNETARMAVPPSQITTSPSTNDVWVNGMWMTSLVLSISTALLAVLAKQWLRYYASPIVGSTRERAFIHYYRWEGFDKWKVRHIIGFLPIILHLAVLLFLGGLCVWLYDRHITIARVTLGLSCAVAGFYLISTTLPFFIPQCPYRTHVPTVIGMLKRLAALTVFAPLYLVWITLGLIDGDRGTNYKGRFGYNLDSVWRVASGLAESSAHAAAIPLPNDIPERSAKLGRWVINISSNLSAKRIAFHALACCGFNFNSSWDILPANVAADFLNVMKDRFFVLRSGKMYLRLGEAAEDFSKWAFSAIASQVNMDEDHDLCRRLIWRYGTELVVPNRSIGLLVFKIFMESSREFVTITVDTSDSVYQLYEDDLLDLEALLGQPKPDSKDIMPCYPHHIWESLSKWYDGNRCNRFIPDVKSSEKDLWANAVVECLNNKDVYLKKLEYPESHQVPISLARYYAPKLEEKGWLDPAQWKDAIIEDVDEKEKAVFWLRTSDDDMAEALRLFVSWESELLNTGSPPSFSQPVENAPVAQVASDGHRNEQDDPAKRDDPRERLKISDKDPV